MCASECRRTILMDSSKWTNQLLTDTDYPIYLDASQEEEGFMLASTGVTPGELASSSDTTVLRALCRSVESAEPESKNALPPVAAANLIIPWSAPSLMRMTWRMTPLASRLGLTSSIHGAMFSSPSLTSNSTPPLGSPASSRTCHVKEARISKPFCEIQHLHEQ